MLPLRFLKALNETFEKRVWFVGLQGSYSRGEATKTSDIDVVVILDELSASDIQRYNATLDTLPHRELICGFLSGKEELEGISGVMIGSVVPSLTKTVKAAVSKLTCAPVYTVGPGIKTGFPLKIDDPRELGADLAANAAGALE